MTRTALSSFRAKAVQSVLLVAVYVWIALLGVSTGYAQQSEAQLEELRAELAERQRKLASSKASANEIQQVLKTSELAIANVATALNQTEQSLRANQQEQKALGRQQDQLKQSILDQQQMLASQLKSAFVAGQFDYAKMIFYQQEANKFERLLTYYEYLANARKRAIQTFRGTVDELASVTAELEVKAQELGVLRQEQTAQQNNLVARKQDREQTLAKLNKQIASDEQRVAALRENEKTLLAAIAEAERKAEEAARRQQRDNVSLNGLAKLKGKLLVPAQGRLRQLFGKRREGQVQWTGIVIEGDDGSAVRSVADGKVLYADWMRGFGLVTIVDHGEGYMSVYGHNQAILHQAGDNVRAGDTIALVGQSGGQSYPNLYFEIRLKGKALNPSQWLDI